MKQLQNQAASLSLSYREDFTNDPFTRMNEKKMGDN